MAQSMGELQMKRPFTLPPPPLPPQSSSRVDPPSPVSSSRVETHPAPANPPSPFDPSRVIGVIRRMALIKGLAAVYHAECLTYCRELLELQSKVDEGLDGCMGLEAGFCQMKLRL